MNSYTRASIRSSTSRVWLVGFTVLGLVLSSLSGVAAAQANPIPDVVRTRDGGMVRGTIVERAADGTITLLLVTGGVRTFSPTEIAYAGPSPVVPSPSRSAPPASPPPAPTSRDAEPRTFDVSVRAHGERRLRVHLVSGEATARSYGSSGVVASARAFEFRQACVLPCTLQLPFGSHRLALSVDSREPAVSEDYIDVNRNVALRASFSDGRPRRRRGLGIGSTLMVVGAGVGLTAIPVRLGPSSCEPGEGCGDLGRAIALGSVGLAMFIGGWVGMIMGMVAHDDAEFEPLTVRF